MHEDFLRALTDKFGLAECIELLPPIPYKDAIDEMMRADVLLILQASNCNDQIPAKLYEYLRAKRPILALTDPLGDTAKVLGEVGISAIAPLYQAGLIADKLVGVLAAPDKVTLAMVDEVVSCSRKNRTSHLASLLGTL